MSEQDLDWGKVQFEHLPRAEQEKLALAALDHRVEAFIGGEWLRKSIIFEPRMVYRIVPVERTPVERTPDQIDWSQIDERFKYMARDQGGATYVYETLPAIFLSTSSGWNVSAREAIRIDNFLKSYKRGTVDWKESLVKRP